MRKVWQIREMKHDGSGDPETVYMIVDNEKDADKIVKMVEQKFSDLYKDNKDEEDFVGKDIFGNKDNLSDREEMIYVAETYVSDSIDESVNYLAKQLGYDYEVSAKENEIKRSKKDEEEVAKRQQEIKQLLDKYREGKINDPKVLIALQKREELLKRHQ